MPIRPENRHRYPADWPAISRRIRFERALGRCECRGECGRPAPHLDVDDRCRNHHGQPAYGTGSNVVLTTAHLDHTPEHCDDANLKAMCQGCHLHYDREHHAQTRAETRRRSLGRFEQPPIEQQVASIAELTGQTVAEVAQHLLRALDTPIDPEEHQ